VHSLMACRCVSKGHLRVIFEGARHWLAATVEGSLIIELIYYARKKISLEHFTKFLF
jgi:hypothetical protein